MAIFRLVTSPEDGKSPVLSVGDLSIWSGEVCLSCGGDMARIMSAPNFADMSVWFELFWCLECRPQEAGEPGSFMKMHSGTWEWDGSGHAFYTAEWGDLDFDEFVSHTGGRPLLMNEEANLSWGNGREDGRDRRHLFSLMDHPEIDFDITGYPMVFFAQDDDLAQISWAADGR